MTDLVKQARDLLDGVTLGPWRVAGTDPWNLTVCWDDHNRVCFLAHSAGLDDARDFATARFIAATRELVPAMADRIEAMEAALRAFDPQRIGHGPSTDIRALHDAQMAARAALEGK